ncbi:MAG TPA: apolipoprotein N-acyltransferase [Blastocatellia bacterium]|nr:apolipoprotein N-acyltransferase [Blastocatellia bacterium]
MPPSLTRDEWIASKLRLTKVLPYQAASPPFVSNLLLAILSGLLMVFAFPEWGLWSFGWIGAAPLIMAAVREPRFWRSFALGTVTGIVFYMGTSYWVTYSMHNYGGISVPLCFVIGLVISSTLGAFTGLFAGTMARLVRRFGGWTVLVSPLIWAASELARLAVTGMGWNSLGYSQAFQPSVIQISQFGGVYLVSALLVLESSALVFALIYLERPRGLIVLTIALSIAIVNAVYGQRVTRGADLPGSVAVAVVQPNLPIEGNWDSSESVSRSIDTHIDMSRAAIGGISENAKAGEDGSNAGNQNSDPAPGRANERSAEGGSPKVSLVVWPESPMPIEYDNDRGLRDRLAEFTRAANTSLLMNTWESPDGKGVRNSAIIISPAGEKVFEYDKVALLPFGEYVPGRSWIPFMSRVTALVGEVTPGTGVKTSDVAGARVGTFICFEVTRPDVARRLRLEGASALIQLSDEAWFGPSAAPRQMLADSIFRAVENNVDLVRSTNSGDSAKIDCYGRIHGLTPMFEPATRTWQIKNVSEANEDTMTFYTKHGDVFGVASVVLSVLSFGISFIPEKWTKGAGKESRSYD